LVGWCDRFLSDGVADSAGRSGDCGAVGRGVKKKGVSRAVVGSDRSVNLVESSAIQQNAGAALDYQKLGETLQGEGKVNEAIAAYKKAIEINPNYFGTYHNLGDLLKAKGKIDEAINAYQKSAKLNPSFAWSYHNLGDLFQQEGQFRRFISTRRSPR